MGGGITVCLTVHPLKDMESFLVFDWYHTAVNIYTQILSGRAFLFSGINARSVVAG